jgi:non-heme chloroperoxidase
MARRHLANGTWPPVTPKTDQASIITTGAEGSPIVFCDGWPFSDAFEDQMFYPASRGYRCIAHDRRGRGRSSWPWNGNDLDANADLIAFTCN